HIPALVRAGKAHGIVLRGMQGSERLQIIGAVASGLGQNVIAVEGSLAPAERHWGLLGPLCSMTRSLPVITYDLVPGETAAVPLLTGYSGPLGIIMGFEGGLSGPAVEKAVTLTAPAPKVEHRMRGWQAALAGHPVADLSEISERFHMPGGYIRQAAA